MTELSRWQRVYLGGLMAWLLFSTTAVWFFTRSSRTMHAVLDMGCGLVWLWCVLGGSLMWRFRDPITSFVRGVRLDWRVKFVLFGTMLAMAEEAVTTGMTNAAPLFGARVGEAYITASANYLDVIALHSVVIFVSFFVGWAVLLWRFDFSPFAVFVLFGITGTLAEMGYGGAQHAAEYAMWAYVYGLMIWLPARSIPPERGAKQAPWWLYLAAVFIPYLFILLFPLAGVVRLLAPNHPDVHFPPIRP